MARYDDLYWDGQSFGENPLARPAMHMRDILPPTKEQRDAEVERVVRERYKLAEDDRIEVSEGIYPGEVRVLVIKADRTARSPLELRFTTRPL